MDGLCDSRAIGVCHLEGDSHFRIIVDMKREYKIGRKDLADHLQTRNTIIVDYQDALGVTFSKEKAELSSFDQNGESNRIGLEYT